jgi:hypothetical protein
MERIYRIQYILVNANAIVVHGKGGAESTRDYSARKVNPSVSHLVIRIFAPRPVDTASVAFQVASGTAVCTVEFDGITDETLGDTYGADSLQALQLAADIEPVLKRLSHRYDCYFPTGEGYFDD